VAGAAEEAADAASVMHQQSRIVNLSPQSITNRISAWKAFVSRPIRHLTLPRAASVWAIAFLFLTAVSLIASASPADTKPTQHTFSTPAAAARALADAAKTDDVKALNSILGPDAGELLSSGDPVADNNAREDFVRRYDQMHRLAFDANRNVILYIGADNWPLPIPLVHESKGWRFDSSAGAAEMIFRRIGRNELFTIDVLKDLADAQREYASEKRAGSDQTQFAQKIVSDRGKQNGLFWPPAEGQPESPMGPRFAQASNEGYEPDASGKPVPFHGYYYKILLRQGRNAPGGAMDYLADGKMTKGFAFLAYPADYRSSGVMTFMINQDGAIVQKDLGPHTEKLAAALTEFNPDESWDEDFED
jgi:DUF2950 family protein